MVVVIAAASPMRVHWLLTLSQRMMYRFTPTGRGVCAVVDRKRETLIAIIVRHGVVSTEPGNRPLRFDEPPLNPFITNVALLAICCQCDVEDVGSFEGVSLM